MGKQAFRLFFAFFLLLIPASAFAHGMAVYASTPVTPPRGMLWVSIAFVAGSTFWDWVLFRKHVATRRLIEIAIGYLFVYWVVFFGIGVIVANLNTAPPPGLGMPCTAFRGLSWEDVGGIFVFWNVVGLLLLVVMKSFFVRKLRKLENHRKKSRWLPAVGHVGIYLLALVPFVATHSLTHGWAGGYVSRGCKRNLETLAGALVRYARANGGKLPAAETAEGLMQSVAPYVKGSDRFWSDRVDVCPIEDAQSRSPRPYVWSKAIAGVALRADSKVDPKTPVLSCPVDHDIDSAPVVTFWHLIYLSAGYPEGALPERPTIPWNQDKPWGRP